MAQVTFSHPPPHPLKPSNSNLGHLKVPIVACTAPYQRLNTNKHQCLGRSQRTKLYCTAGGGGGGGGVEEGSSCIKSKGCTCGATLTERLQSDASTLLRQPQRTISETLCEGEIHWMINLTLLEDYSFYSRCFFEKSIEMDIHVLISVLSVMYSWILCTVLSAPADNTPTASTATQARHVRTKRCSCATFRDKECVYFCHLDIIWVNTPERVVSYGLGSAPRTKRAVADSTTISAPRCQCARENDATCRNFCRLEKHPRYGTSPETVIRSAKGDGCAETQCKHKLAADTGRIRRTKSSNKKRVSPLAIKAALKTRLLLEKWRVRQRHRARAWEGKSAAS
ncbi:endothelin-1 [Notolabrus celidotus]|uniref:endothelin-1 n=1 Tax=Notolabrus celidotus TaxID=1203425 RepID=UPI00149060D9|nr:endothelin-1 [Notolabrus celidotus]